MEARAASSSCVAKRLATEERRRRLNEAHDRKLAAVKGPMLRKSGLLASAAARSKAEAAAPRSDGFATAGAPYQFPFQKLLSVTMAFGDELDAVLRAAPSPVGSRSLRRSGCGPDTHEARTR